MIEIKHLNKYFGEEKVLDNLSLKLPRYGLVSILGPSGCGKTTLLNCLGGLLDFEGSIKIDGRNLEKMSDDEKSLFRLNNIGFIFQDFKLFETQKVVENISLPLKTLTNYSDKKIERKVAELLDIVDLSNYKKRLVNTLSGGEKQRISICRAIVNNPKVVLADEPTGALDTATSEKIMKILQEISQKSLVIMVTHDDELAEKYSDEIIYLEDGKIKKIIHEEKSLSTLSLSISDYETTNKKPSIPNDFVFKHILQCISFKKIRSSISFLFMSLGLLGIGLSIAFSSSIANDIKRSYASIVESSKIFISKKTATSPSYQTLSYDDAYDIKKEHNDLIKDVGVIYKADFETFFKHTNELHYSINGTSYFLDGFSARTINEFFWKDELGEPIYPESLESIENDEVVLGLNILQVRTMCYLLGIEKTVTALSNYLERETIKLVFDFANDDWDYSDQQVLSMVGFVLTNEPIIVNSNHLWNKYMLEDRMRFPSDEEYELYEYPWVMEKLTYFQVYDTYDTIKALRNDKTTGDIVLDLGDKKYFPTRELNTDPLKIEKLFPFYVSGSTFSFNEISYINEADENLSNEIIYNDKAYIAYPSNLLSGFLNKTYFSFDENLLYETIENNSSIRIEENEKEVVDDAIICSDFANSFSNCVIFSSYPEELISGKFPSDIDEIVISKGLFGFLFREDLPTDFLNIAFITNEINEDYGIYSRQYVLNKVKITGITNSEKLVIYQNSFWTSDYYLLRVGLSAFDLLPRNISYSFKDESKQEKTIQRLKIAFPQYEIINPLNDINKSVDELCTIISYFVLFIASISLIISFILLLSCSYLQLQDMKKDIALTRCLGITKKESLKFLYFYTGITGGISLIVSSVELVVVSIVISFATSSELSIAFNLDLNPLGFLTMACVTIFLSFISSVVFGEKVSKIQPSECLKT